MSWDGFLKSLESEGGKMLTLICMIVVVLSAPMVLILTGHPIQDAGRQAIIAVASSLFGILYGYLKAGGSKPQ